MSDHSTIEWTDATWNPVRGCEKVSAGCKNCYAERFAERWRGIPGHPFEQGFDLRLVPDALDLPLHWRRTRRVFVNSMSDLFHDDVPDAYIAAAFGVMAATPQHTYQILTKRPARMVAWFRWLDQVAERCASVFPEDPLEWRRAHGLRAAALRHGVHPEASAGDMEARGWPLPNVWIGVSVEDQHAADERIPLLLETPAAVRFLSCEPLLGPVTMQSTIGAWAAQVAAAAVEGRPIHPLPPRIGWVVVGGESGPGARPCDVAWIRSLVKECRDAGVPAFVKQLGAMPVIDSAAWRALAAAGPAPLIRPGAPDGCERLALKSRKGGDPAEWPEDLRVREMPEVTRG